MIQVYKVRDLNDDTSPCKSTVEEMQEAIERESRHAADARIGDDGSTYDGSVYADGWWWWTTNEEPEQTRLF